MTRFLRASAEAIPSQRWNRKVRVLRTRVLISVVQSSASKKEKKKKERKGNHLDRAAQFSSMSMTLVFLLFSCSSEHTMHLSIPIISSCSRFTCNFGRNAGNVKDTPAVSYFPQSVASFKHAILRNFYLLCSEYAASAAVDSSVAEYRTSSNRGTSSGDRCSDSSIMLPTLFPAAAIRPIAPYRLS